MIGEALIKSGGMLKIGEALLNVLKIIWVLMVREGMT